MSEAMDIEARLASVTRRAVRRFGATQQWEMLVEECGELIAAHNQFKRQRITDRQLAEEIADVVITLAQARYALGDDIVSEAIVRKLARLEKRLDEAGAA
jgi:NTP pyrophosphatase (non-canonical NTP hydrolase)